MIVNLSSNNVSLENFSVFSYQNEPLVGKDESPTFQRLVKNFDECGLDLEPLPFFRLLASIAFSLSVLAFFESYDNDEVFESIPASVGQDPHPWLTSTIQKQAPEDFVALDTQSPADYDVVCSRTKKVHDLPGSERFRRIVRAFIPAYTRASTRSDKSAVIAAIIDRVMDHPEVGPIRFLKFDNVSNTWITLRSCQIRDKVGHALRETIQEMEREKRKKMHSIRQVAAPAS